MYYTVHTGLNDAWGDGELIHLYGEKFLQEHINGLQFNISPRSFFQTNSYGAEKLYEKVIEYVEFCEPVNIFDLYCGTGTIGQILAKNF